MHPTDDLTQRGLVAAARAASPKDVEPAKPLTADDVRAIVREVIAEVRAEQNDSIRRLEPVKGDVLSNGLSARVIVPIP